MSTIIHHPAVSIQGRTISGVSLLSKFIDWCRGQEEKRIQWVGVGLTLHGCLFTPLTFMTVALSGLNFFLLVPVMLAMLAVLIVNLAAMPTRVTIPVLAVSLIVDVLILAACIISGFSL
jgi:hypothetical protein